ncbi:extracellular solute-binding protein [Plantactinospora sp. S1510]|uniref:Extracellular solute-binding protein n=1 Tax=Plantactinospora alkalitolerans TaxID=2789879 RepID=A0ABS0H3V1_9ACTN|nr:extracellular solute-binding protein [Plantactinospora alkalitolerans]MBF9133143.1 extracellular solute-binding protein [Plantactinospora alkalitolerans]
MHQLTRRQLLAAAGGAATLVLVGCGSGDENGDQNLDGKRVGAMDDYGVGDQFKAAEALTFSIAILDNPGYPYKADWPFFQELSKRTNIKFDATVIPLSDYNQKRSVMVAAGNAPWIIPKTYHPSEEEYIAGGAVLPVSDYVHLMPHFQDKVKKWNLQPDIDAALKQADGKYYLLPGLHEDAWLDYSLAMRTDILAQLNLQVPTTWDELTTVLRAMKQAHPDVYPLSDRWSTTPEGPGANNLLAHMSDAYDTRAGWDWRAYHWDPGASKFVFPGAMDNYRQILQYLNTLVSEKLMDPESFTQQDDLAKQKFGTGKSFVISTNAQELINSYRKDLTARLPGAKVEKITRLMGPMGATKRQTRLESGVMISKKALDSKNFVAMMQFVDWLWYSDEGQTLAKWGIKDQTFTGSAEEGTLKLASDVDWAGLNPSGSKKLNVDYGYLNGVFAYGGSTKFLNSQFTEEEKKFQEAMAQRKLRPEDPAHPLTPEEREQTTLWATALKDHVNQQSLRFILGQRPLSDWNAYVSELKGKNMDQLIEVHNKAYERFKKEHG